MFVHVGWLEDYLGRDRRITLSSNHMLFVDGRSTGYQLDADMAALLRHNYPSVEMYGKYVDQKQCDFFIRHCIYDSDHRLIVVDLHANRARCIR
jgi:hypothetical protein